jgi:phenylacetate-CoA ligase
VTRTLPDYDTADPALSTLPREELRALQDERLRAIVAYAYATSPFWRAKLAGAGIEPADIRGVADLPSLPFTTRAELDAEQAAHPPFGEYSCSPRESWQGVYTTSGTSGRKLKRVVSRRDWRLMIDRFYRNPAPPQGEIFMLLGPIDGVLGATVGVEAARERGQIPVLAGMWDTRTKVEAIAELRPGVIAGAASYILHLAEVAREIGVDLAGCGLRGITSFGEPGAGIAATQEVIARSFGVREIIDGYGLTEVWPLGGNCPHSQALHIPDDLVAVECVDRETLEPLPEGETGEIVFTSLVGDTQPLLRYRSRDIGRLCVSAPCGCGATVTRIEAIEGRSDDMIWYRGVNFFPSAVENIVRRQRELSTEYRIVLDDGPRGMPVVTVQVEPRPGDRHDQGVLERVRDALRSGLGVNPEVEVLAAGSLPRVQQAKAKRVLDRRRRAGTPASGRGAQ